RLVQLAGARIDHRHGLAGIVHEQLLAGPVVLAHHQVAAPEPLPVALAEPAVLIPVRVTRPVLLPQQEQSHALALELAVDGGPVRHGPLLGRRRRGEGKQQSGEGSSLDKTAFSAGGVCGFFGKAGHADGSHFKRGPVVQAPLSRLDPFAQAMTPGPGVARWCNTLVWGTDPYLLATVRILAGYNRMLISTLSASELAMKQNRWARSCILSISAG